MVNALSLAGAARALDAGDALGALSLAGRDDTAEGLMVRGIAYAQLGDLELSARALERAARLSGAGSLTRARARAAQVEVDLARGDAASAARVAQVSAEELDALGDARNAAMQRLVLARAEVLLGRLHDARARVSAVLAADLPADLHAVGALAEAEIALRSLAATQAKEALSRARRSLATSPHPLLSRALSALERELTVPVARTLRRGVTAPADLVAIEAASSGETLLVDACRHLASAGRVAIPFARRPVLFALLLVLSRAWPATVPRDELAARAFDTRRPNASHRARLRVEIGRLRARMDGLAATPVATREGYALDSTREVTVLLPATDDEAARVALLLGDGASWSAMGLAEHAGISKRTALRALARLVETGGAVRSGTGSRVRYARPAAPIASRMLLLGLLPRG